MSYSAIAAVASLSAPAASLVTQQFDPYVLLQIFYFVPGLSMSGTDRKSTRLNSSHTVISYAVFCLKTKEHTSELQSHSDIVCRLLLEKKRCTSPREHHKSAIPQVRVANRENVSYMDRVMNAAYSE